MKRYHVAGSRMEYMFSLDCLADSESEASQKFENVFGFGLLPRTYDLDSVADNFTTTSSPLMKDCLRKMRERFEDGRKYESGGYHYSF